MSFGNELYEHLLNKIPQLHISCKTGKNIGKIIPLVTQVYQRYTRKLDTLVVYRIFHSALQKTPLMHNRMPLILNEVFQLQTRPITLCLVVNEPDWFGPSQLAFFENILRTEYDLTGVPVKFVLKKPRK